MAASVEFVNADDLQGEIVRIIRENGMKFSHLNVSLFVLRRRVSETPAKWIARLSLVPKRFKDTFNGAAFILEVDQMNFDLLTPKQKEVVLFRELCRTFLTEKGTYKLVKYDVQEFLAVIEKYGEELPEMLRLMNLVKTSKKEAVAVFDEESEDSEMLERTSP